MHQFIYRFHKFILVLCAFLTLFSIFSITKLKLNLNLFSLLPSGDPRVSTFLEISEKVWGHSLLIALLEMPPGLNRNLSESFVDDLADNFRASSLINEVEYKTEKRELSALIEKLIGYSFLFLRENDLEKIVHKLSDNGIRSKIQDNKKLLMTPFNLPAKELIFKDPLGFWEIFKSTPLIPAGKRTIRNKKGYYRNDTGTYFLFLKPTRAPQDIAFSKKLMKEVENITNTSLSNLPTETGNDGKRIKISFAGGYPIAVKDQAATKRDIKTTIITSFLGVMILFGLSFRRLRIIFYVGIPLVAGLLWTLGFAVLVFNRLNILTCIFSCVLIGLGIDFAIHIVNRFFDNKYKKLDLKQRILKMYKEAGTGVVIGGITTAVAFYSIGISDFGGFKELGFLTGTGILFSLSAMLFLLPSLLVYFENEKTPKRPITLAGFGIKGVVEKVVKNPWPALLISMLAIFIFASLGIKAKFDDNLRNFRPVDDEIFQLQGVVSKWLGGSTGEILLVTDGASEAEVMEINSSIYEALLELKSSEQVAGIKSISRYLRPPSTQKKIREFVRERHDIFDIERIKKTYFQALDENGFEKLDSYERYFELLSKAIDGRELLFPSTLKGTKLGEFIEHSFFQTGNRFKAITFIVPKKDLWSRAETARFRELIVRKLDEYGITKNKYYLTGANLLTGDLKTHIIKNLKSSLWFAALGIVGVLFVYYRSAKLVLLSALPLMIGLAILSGIMVIFRLDFNFFNAIVVPMIVGIGIDDGVHFTNTYIQQESGNMSDAMSQTGRAVVLTSLTTLIGFGSIALSHYPGLRSMGYVAIIGITACLFASIIVLPAIFSLISNHGEG